MDRRVDTACGSISEARREALDPRSEVGRLRPLGEQREGLDAVGAGAGRADLKNLHLTLEQDRLVDDDEMAAIVVTGRLDPTDGVGAKAEFQRTALTGRGVQHDADVLLAGVIRLPVQGAPKAMP